MKRTKNAKAAKHGVDAITMASAMPLATMITLSHRLPMLAEALASSEAWRNPEFLKMTSEKVQAAGQSATAFGDAITASQQVITGYALAQAGANLALVTQTPQTPADLQAFGSSSLRRFWKLAETLNEIGSRTAATGIRPAHQKVTANAKRLGSRRPRD